MLLTSKVNGWDLMMGCWNFSMRVGGLKSFLLGSEDSLNLIHMFHHPHFLLSILIFSIFILIINII